MEKKSERVYSIDLLRTIALFLIVFFHIYYNINPKPELRYLGSVGIGLFFIISGYLLARKYKDLEDFSPKWMFRRFLKIITLFYLALIAYVLLFGRQVYTGSVWKNLLYHFLFIYEISDETSLGIISAAWFLIPLMGLYLLFPYLNKAMKHHKYSFSIVMFMVVLFRTSQFNLISFNPLFFLAEFCFGILFAHYNSLYLLSAFLMVLVPYFGFIMTLPFIIFYLLYFVNIKLFSRIFGFIGRRTLAIFLFHEAFIMIYFGYWKIYTLSMWPALFLMLVVTVFLSYISCKIQNFIFSKYLNNRKDKQVLEKEGKMDKKTITELLFVIFSIVVIVYFIYIIVTPSSAGGDGLASLKPGLESEDKPILIVSVENCDFEMRNGKCFVSVNGTVTNLGGEAAEDVMIRCRPAIYPVVETNIQASKQVGDINYSEKIYFQVEREIDCGQQIRFDCTAECRNS